jgi:hypothetical protein
LLIGGILAMGVAPARLLDRIQTSVAQVNLPLAKDAPTLAADGRTQEH